VALAVYKYLVDDQVALPRGARILSVQIQNDRLTLWALVDPAQPPVQCNFFVVGTGHVLPDKFAEFHYIGTAQHGPLVWHVFEEILGDDVH